MGKGAHYIKLDLNTLPRPHINMEGKSNSTKLFSDLSMCTIAFAVSYPLTVYVHIYACCQLLSLKPI